MNTDTIIDAFVDKINHSPKRRIREEDVPCPLREGGAEYGLYYNWTIQRFHRINWITPTEEQIARKLPPTYRSLVTRYIFPAFDIDSIILLANTGQTLYHEMFMAMAHDKVLSGVLLKKGYAQFARPASGHSDPVCFDFNQANAQGECPIVRISHQNIVVHSRIDVTEELSPSFSDFVDRYLRTEPQEVKA